MGRCQWLQIFRIEGEIKYVFDIYTSEYFFTRIISVVKVDFKNEISDLSCFGIPNFEYQAIL